MRDELQDALRAYMSYAGKAGEAPKAPNKTRIVAAGDTAQPMPHPARPMPFFARSAKTQNL